MRIPGARKLYSVQLSNIVFFGGNIPSFLPYYQHPKYQYVGGCARPVYFYNSLRFVHWDFPLYSISIDQCHVDNKYFKLVKKRIKDRPVLVPILVGGERGSLILACARHAGMLARVLSMNVSVC